MSLADIKFVIDLQRQLIVEKQNFMYQYINDRNIRYHERGLLWKSICL